MKRTIKVFLGGEPRWVGTLHYDAAGSRERSAFSYAETWLGTADRLAIDPALPLVAGPQFHRKIQFFASEINVLRFYGVNAFNIDFIYRDA